MGRITIDSIKNLVPPDSFDLVHANSQLVIDADLKDKIITLILDKITYNDITRQNITNCIERFIGENATFSNLNLLKRDLQWIYNHLILLDESKLNQKIAILEYLIEDMAPDLCTEGFYNRVQNLVNIISTPDSFAELVSKVCTDLVQQCISVFIHELKTSQIISIDENSTLVYRQGYEVHYAKLVLQVAYIHNFGVSPQDEDPYLPLTPELERYILIYLTKGFAPQFTEFYLFLNLINKIKTIVQEHYEYSGYGDYTSAQAMAIYNFLTRIEIAPHLSNILSEAEEEIFYSYFITEELEIGGKLIHDLNLQKIKIALAQVFIEKNFQALSLEQKQTIIKMLENDEDYNFSCLLNENVFSSHSEFFNFIQCLQPLNAATKMYIYQTYIEHTAVANQVEDLNDWQRLILQFIDDEDFINAVIPFYQPMIQQRSNLLLLTRGRGNFLMRALESQKDNIIKLALLDFNCLDLDDKIALLRQVNGSGYNVLMLAILYYPKCVRDLLDIISATNDHTIVCSIISQVSYDNKTCFMFATKHSDVFNLLLDLIINLNSDTRDSFINLSDLLKLNDAEGNSVLTNLITLNPDLLREFLNKIYTSRVINILDLINSSAIFDILHECKSPLHIAAEQNPDSFQILVSFIENLHLEVRKSIYKQPDVSGCSAFHYLVISSPEKAIEFFKILVRDLSGIDLVSIFEKVLVNQHLAPYLFNQPNHEILFGFISIAKDIAKLDTMVSSNPIYNKWKKDFLKYLNSNDETYKNKFLAKWERFKTETPNIFPIQTSTSSSSFFSNKRNHDDTDNNVAKRHRDNEPEF